MIFLTEWRKTYEKREGRIRPKFVADKLADGPPVAIFVIPERSSRVVDGRYAAMLTTDGSASSKLREISIIAYTSSGRYSTHRRLLPTPRVLCLERGGRGGVA